MLRLIWPSLLAVVIVALISFPLLRYGDRQWRDSIAETVPVHDNMLLAKSHLSKGYLFLEKRIAGDETIRIEDIYYMYGQAGQLINDCLEGRSSIVNIKGTTPTDPKLIDKLEQFHLEIERFQDISRERWEKRELPDVGITIQQRSSFYLLEYMANDIVLLLDQKTVEALDRQGLITSITLSVWTVILMLICYLIFLGGRRRWFAEEEVRNYQTKLEGLVKERTSELSITNEQLQQEITERRMVEQNFRNSLDNSPLGIRITSLERHTVYINKALLDIYGYSNLEEMQAVPREQRHTPEDYALVEKRYRHLRLGEPVESHYTIDILRPNGEVRHLETFRREVMWDGKPCYQILYLDVTERREAEKREWQLRQELHLASRLATVGEMAAGIAHEINNPLTGVIGFSELLLKKDLPEDTRKDVNIIHDGARRIASVTDRMLRFTRQTKPETKRVNINDIIEITLAMRASEMKTGNINITTELAPDLPLTDADAGLLQQVFLNIILNAEMELKLAHGKGNLTVKTERIGNTIRASFKDDGPGI
ncbi:nitrogen regulation protein NR(II), partial [Chloroflexota bacterium]